MFGSSLALGLVNSASTLVERLFTHFSTLLGWVCLILRVEGSHIRLTLSQYLLIHRLPKHLSQHLVNCLIFKLQHPVLASPYWAYCCT